MTQSSMHDATTQRLQTMDATLTPSGATKSTGSQALIAKVTKLEQKISSLVLKMERMRPLAKDASRLIQA